MGHRGWPSVKGRQPPGIYTLPRTWHGPQHRVVGSWHAGVERMELQKQVGIAPPPLSGGSGLVSHGHPMNWDIQACSPCPLSAGIRPKICSGLRQHLSGSAGFWKIP